jgi:integrase
MNATKAELSQLQEQIAAGRAPMLPAGKAEELYWHPTISGFGLRLYANGSGTWLLQYRNKRRLQRRHKIGSAAVLNLTFATNAAKQLIGQIAAGDDPQSDRQEALTKPSFTFGAMAKRFLEERKPGAVDGLCPHTWQYYEHILRNRIGQLGRMQVDEIESVHIADKVTQIANDVGRHSAIQTRSFLSSVYKWGRKRGLITVPNPVQDTWKPEAPKSKARSLSLEELGAIWRAAEAMAKGAATILPTRGGRGGKLPKQTPPARSIRADSIFLSKAEASRQTGLRANVLWCAIKRGDLKATFRRELPEAHPIKIKQGYHRRAYMIQQGELNRYIALHHVRTPQADYSAIVRLLILLGGRYNEMGALHWDEVDLDNGILHIKGPRTAERRGTKNKHDLYLPLPPMAVAILREIKQRPGRSFVFGDGPKGMRNPVAMKKQLDALIAKAESAPLKPWRNHDLRHTLSTEMNEMGIDSRVVETIVNHWSGHRSGIAGRYNHAKYWKQVKQALEAWAQTVRNVADGVEPDTNVVRLAFGQPAIIVR